MNRHISPAPSEAATLKGDARLDYVRELFDRIAPRYDFLRKLVFLGHTSHWYRSATRALKLKPGMTVLDVGCGTGESTRTMLHRYPGIRVEGMDLSPGMLAVARRRDPVSHYFEGDAGAIPRDDGAYDLVFTAFTFRNFADQRGAMREMLRVLRPAGRLLIVDHFCPTRPLLRNAYVLWMRRLMPLVVRPFVEDVSPYRYLAETIIRQFTTSDFVSLIESFGAICTEVRPCTGGAAVCFVAEPCRQNTEPAGTSRS